MTQAPPRPQADTNQSNGHKLYEDAQAQRAYIQALLKKIVPEERPYFPAKCDQIIKVAEKKAQTSATERSIQTGLEQSLKEIGLEHLLAEPKIEVVRDEALVPPLPEGIQFPSEASMGACP